jgi:Ca2+-binding EF-hand superfamily protein
LTGLGYEVAFDHNSDQEVSYQALDPTVYRQTNGYIPRPIDLASVSLPKSVLPFIERMAENIHNIWAVDRIQEGWTYGISENSTLKQNPALVPYQNLSEKLKESNRSTALESFKCLYAFGARIIPPEDGSHRSMDNFAHESIVYNQKKRTIRGQLNYGQMLDHGQWYFEVTILTSGSIRVGWAKPTMHPETGLGEDEESFAFDGSLGRKLHGSSAPFGRPWKKNDIVGCLLDCDARTMCFSLNGAILTDSFEDPIAFNHFNVSGGFMPAVTLGPDQLVKLNFGNNENTQLHKLENYGFGPSQGYVPISMNSYRSLPLWYSVDYPMVQTLKADNHPRLTITRRNMSGLEGSGYMENILVAVRDDHNPVFSRLECIRLNSAICLPSDTSLGSMHTDVVHLHRQKSLSQEISHSSKNETGSYTVHIPPGQDPRHVLVGWTAPDFVFSPSTLTATLAQTLEPNSSCVDQSVKITDRVNDEYCTLYSSAFLLPLLYLVDDSQAFMSVEITSTVRSTSREIEFCVDGSVVKKLSVQTKADIKLYPTVIISPSPETNHLLSFIITENTSTETNVLITETSKWACCPEENRHHVLKQDDHFRFTCERTDSTISILVPWEDRVFNLREIVEDEHLSNYHVATLKLLEGLSTYGYSQSPILLKIQEILGQEELLYMMQLIGLPCKLRSAVFSLARVLFVQEKVTMRSFVKEENIVCLPPKKNKSGNYFDWDEDEFDRMKEGCMSATYRGVVNFEDQGNDILMKLKDIAFSRLNYLLFAGETECQFMTQEGRIYLLQPLIELCDDLLVAGVLNKKSEVDLLLSMLDPLTFPTPEGCAQIPCGLVARNLEEPIKLAICRLLHHIHDCQLHQRLQYVVACSEVLVKKIQEEQKGRFSNGEGRRSREFMSTPEQQIDLILAPREAAYSTTSDEEDSVLVDLELFHSELCRHCDVVPPPDEDVKDNETLKERLQLLYRLVNKDKHTQSSEPAHQVETETSKFHTFVAKLMMSWSQKELLDRTFIKELFSLLYRQYNRASEVAKALQKTFVVQLTSVDVSGLFSSVGMLRSLLTVGMGSIEERTLKDSLKRISQSQAFKENAELMRFLKVHITTLSLLKDYLGVTEVRGKEWKKKRVRKKDAVLQGVVSETVQACCSFLHSFTCINEHNQIAMFDHIDFLLKCTESNPELLNYAGHGPIDVASAIIHNNDELVLFLRDSQLEGVVKLLSQQFTKHATLSASSVKSNDIWTMRGANKCLEFLSRAVWCKGKYVKENALIVIRLLLRHSECLDPIINNQQGLSDLFRSALFHDYSFDRDKSRSPLSPGVQMQVASSSDDETESKKSSEFSAITPRSSSMFSKRMMFASPSTVSIASTSSILMSDSEGATLRFLADLLQLLGYCAPSLPDEVRLDVNLTKQAKKLSRQYTQLNLFASSAPHTEDAAAAGNLETSIARHTHSLLRDLIDRDDILEVLNIPLSSQYWEKFNPMHKEACLLFYDRVYGIEDSDQLYQFISSVSLPDLKFTISMASTEVEDEEESHHLFVLCDYVTDHLLPVMSKKEHLLEGLDSDIAHDTVESFLLCCYQFSVSVHLSPVQRTKVANFLATICRALKPSVLMNLMPKIFNDLPDLQPKNITTLKFLTEHYTHFKRYYHINSGWKTIGCGAASDEERRFSSSLCFKLLQRLCFGELEPHVLSYGVKCLKAVVTALHPSMYVAIQDASSDTVEYRPKQIDVSRVVLTSSQEALIENFCTHLHDIWALEMLSDEWEFDEEHNESLKKHPNLVHYKQLPQEERESKRNNVMFLVKVLLARGFGIIASKNKHTTDLSKAFDTVTDFSSSNYTPSPVDLSQVKASRLFTHISRRLAQWSHEQWAAQLMEEDEGYRDHPHFRPYEDLDDDTKEEKKGLPLDLLKFISFSGYNIVRTRAQTWAKEGMLLSEETAKFATLLFSTLLDILGTSEKRFSLPKTKLILVVVLPVLTQFLNSNAMVFHSSGSGNMEDLPRKEKSLVIKLLSQVWHFCQQNYTMICLRKTTSAQSPQTSLNISVTAECLTALCKTLHVKEFFTSKMLDSEEAIALQEFLDGTLLELETAQHQGKELSLQMFDFSFQVIVPCLSSFFKCISFRKDHKILQTKLGNVALRIFHCVYDFGRRGLVHFSFVTSDVYSTIGECLAAFIEAYPMRILESSEESTVISVTELMMQMEQAGQAGCDCASVEYIEEVVLPLLCSYMAKYWIVQLDHKQSCLASQVSAEQLNKTVSDITNFVWSFFGQDNVPWMFRAIGHIRLMIQCCSSSFLKVILQPMADGLKTRTLKLWQDEVYIHSRWTTSSPEFGTYLQALLGQYTVLSRDLVVCLSMLTVFLDARDGTSDLSDSDSNLDDIFLSVTQIFHCWFTSPHLRRELLSQQGLFLKSFPNYFSAFTQGKSRPGNVTVVGHQSTVRTSPCNILKLCVTKLLKYHVSKLSNKEKLILTNCKPIVEDSMLDSQSLKIAVQEEINKVNGDGTQRRVVHKSSSFSGSILSLSSNGAVNVLVELVKIENRLHQGDVDSVRKSPSRWKKIKVLTDNRRRAVIRCFMSVPYFKLPMTRALNIFLHTYQEKWFDSVQKGSHLILREEMLHSATHKGQVCPLTQLLHFFSQEALAGHVPVNLYSDFGLVLSMYCNVYVAEDDMDEDDPTINYKKFAEMRARLLESQNQLCTRGAAVTILQVLAYTRGQDGPLAEMSIHLGIALLKGGNETVQKVLLEKLGTMDAEVLKCIESLIGRCSVLRWEGHERSGYSSLESHCTGNLPDYKFIWSLFRFLQLLCEGHNEEFQNYLRTQDSNSATINVVVCTVDYLLRLQESISDYCWYLSEDGVVGSHRREALNRAMMLSNQVLRTLTEYIQGPCIGNQKALASSRVWDATSGFLKLFASLQWKLGKNSNQIELLLDLLKVQKSLFTFLQSMLEGVEMNSITARIMANMLVEESAVVMDIMQFYNMFLELKDLVTAQAFKEYDLNGDGWISRMEFQKAMETHSSYSPSEINYMMDCADLDKDGRLDYLEFTRRFHSPAEQIGFDLCVLVTTLAEHLPNNKCIERLRLSRSSIFAYFEKSLGRIEIVGKSGNVERVYFEIKPWWMHQWQERQVQDSKREFIQNLDVHSQRQKLGAFIDFCEDTIFEIQHAAKINEIESQEEIRKAEFHRKQHMGTELKISSDVTGHSQASLPVKALIFVLHILSIVWTVHLPKFRRKCVSLWQYSRWAVAPKGAFENGQMQRTQQPKPPVENGPDSPTSASPSSADSQVSTPTSSYPLPNFNRSEIKPPSEFSSLEVDFSLMAASSESSKPMISARHRMGSWSSTLARHYYRLHIVLLILTALINVCLLSYKIARGSLLECIKERHSDVCATELAASSWVTAILTLLGCTHAMVAGILLVSYYHLKIPLLLFKREKQIARELEFSKKWLTVAPESYKEKWDSLVLKSPMFPKLLWDKQLKSRLVAQHGAAALPLFGMDKHKATTDSVWSASWAVVIAAFDKYLRYYVWSLGVLATNLPLLYRFFGFLVSVLGLFWSPFFFSIHLLDFVWSSTDLQNVLKSVMLNYRQVVVTMLMTCTVVYLYTVVAFNMFQKYYLTDQTDSVVPNCDTMFKCFLYHLNHGLRSGGGIADVIASAVDDDMEGIRLIFDMSFFFFVIIILLAIIQGLIIDSFGKLRNKEEAQKEEMQTHCFICGLQKDKLEEIPHGFEQHTRKEHHMAHYMFFLMHLIQKPETEFTGQESHVWENYCQRKWDFFPVAESFRHRKTQNITEIAQ